MKKLILASLLFFTPVVRADHPVIESFQKYPEVLIALVSFGANTDRRYVKPNYYAILTSLGIFTVHRLIGGKSPGALNAAAYVAAAGAAKVISKPVHNFWDDFKRKVSYIWNYC